MAIQYQISILYHKKALAIFASFNTIPQYGNLMINFKQLNLKRIHFYVENPHLILNFSTRLGNAHFMRCLNYYLLITDNVFSVFM